MLTVPGELDVEVALLERVAARDAAAVGELYDRQSSFLYGIIRRILRDEAEAEDVLQEVFVRVWEHADSYEPVLGSPVAWLARIARNRAIDRLRSRHVRERVAEPVAVLPDVAGEAGTDGDPERWTAISEAQRAIGAALGRLPREQRALIEAAYYGGYTQSELAARFDVPLGTVKTRIRTGMMALRTQLAAQGTNG